ncbi:hypothetical protein Peur_067833 [Populus x canadensis]
MMRVRCLMRCRYEQGMGDEQGCVGVFSPTVRQKSRLKITFAKLYSAMCFRLSAAQNESLRAPVQDDEIKRVVFQVKPYIC